MVNIKFEGITPSLIIEASRPQVGIDYYNIRPIEVVKTKYVAGQTLILKGKNLREEGSLIIHGRRLRLKMNIYLMILKAPKRIRENQRKAKI